MDDKDQTQIYPTDTSGKQTRSRGKRKQPADPAAADEAAVSQITQATRSLANEPQQSRPLQALDGSADHTQLAKLARARPTSQPPRPQAPLPQAIRFPDRDSDALSTEPIARPPARRQFLGRTRRVLRSRAARILIPLLTLVLGIIIGLTSVIWYGLSGEGPLIAVVPAAQGNLVVDANQSFVSQLVRNNLLNAGLPGKVQNITVELEHGAKIIIQGDDVYPVFFVNVTKHFTVDVQPYVHNCVLQVRVTHADLAGIPVTTFVQTFQNKINQQLAKKPAGLPSDFTYCTVGVTTEPGGMYITYLAVPIKK
ncbi:MAG TPA: hypothetical protein VF458_11925 [Ktedonobacteraceae bacterium]